MSRETGWYRVKVAVDAAVVSGWQFAYWYEISNAFKLIFDNRLIKESQCSEIDETQLNPVPADEVKTKTHVNVLNPVYEHDDLTPRIQEAKGWINVKSIYENGLTWDDTKGLKSYDAKTIKTTTTEIRETRVVKEGED